MLALGGVELGPREILGFRTREADTSGKLFPMTTDIVFVRFYDTLNSGGLPTKPP